LIVSRLTKCPRVCFQPIIALHTAKKPMIVDNIVMQIRGNGPLAKHEMPNNQFEGSKWWRKYSSAMRKQSGNLCRII